MKQLPHLFKSNRAWATKKTQANATFFSNLAKQQNPDYLWIGCADSRVPANQIIGLNPGEVFVHRNIANVISHTDFNALSVIEYAVRVLGVKHIIVCGHYGCGGVAAALEDKPIGLIDNWLRHIRDVRAKHSQKLIALDDPTERVNLLCELNVVEQVKNVCHTSIVQEAWRQGQDLCIHGWIYGLADGLLNDLGVTIRQPEELDDAFRLSSDENV